MTQEQQIINYVSRITRGIVSLSEKDAKAIIGIVNRAANSSVIISRFDRNNDAWHAQRRIEVTDEELNSAIATHYENSIEPPIERRFYKYDCVLSDGTNKGTIYTSNNNIFK